MAKDRQVSYIGSKVILAQEKLLERLEDFLLHIEYPTAFLADEVMMMSLVGVMVIESVTAEVGLVN